MKSTTHYLLVRPAVHGGAKVLGSYSSRAEVDGRQRVYGGSILELEFWEENDPGHAEGLAFAAEWLLPG